MEKPILFSADMVRAILKGHKTQTRRIIKPQPNFDAAWRNLSSNPEDVPQIDVSKPFLGLKQGTGTGFTIPNIRVPYHKGDWLWVRETFGWNPDFPDGIHACYRADGHHEYDGITWKPSIFMPRAVSRINLFITDVRAERLQDITEEDAIAEGIEDLYPGKGRYLSEDLHAWRRYDVTKKQLKEPGGHWNAVADGAIDSYKSLWNSINGPTAWDANPWVWVITFKRIGR